MPTETCSHELTQWFASLIVPVFAGFLGVLIGSWLATRRDRARLRIDFRTRQLREFYMLSEFREHVRQQAGTVWDEICKIGRASGDVEALQKLLEPEREKLESRIEYDNKQLEKRLIPGYRRMVQHFRENYWLAEPGTRQYLAALVKFVEGWDRFLSRTHSAEVLNRIDVKEDDLIPFYGHIKTVHDQLRDKVKKAED